MHCQGGHSLKTLCEWGHQVATSAHLRWKLLEKLAFFFCFVFQEQIRWQTQEQGGGAALCQERLLSVGLSTSALPRDSEVV